MATDLREQVKTPAKAKYESYVEEQLTRAGGRVRALDLLLAGLVLGCGVLGYALVMALLDQAFTLPTAVRIVGLCVLFVGVLGYLVYQSLRFFGREVNPYFVARQLEQTLPDAKNSVINWLDLRAEQLPPVIRGAVGRRAAKDLTQADLENVVSTQRLAWLGGIVAALFIGGIIWLLTDTQLPSLLRRAFMPFEFVAIPTHTELVLVKPEGGNVTVPIRSDVQVRVLAKGRVPSINQPDSIKLLYRYRQNDPYLERLLDADVENEWTTTMLADQVQNGFWYKIKGGDAETPEYQVKVKADPQVTRFEVKLAHRPYLVKPEESAFYGPGEALMRPDLRQPRGTEVTLITRTNRPWHEGQLAFKFGNERHDVVGDPVEGDPDARQFTFVLDKNGSYHVLFVTKDGEKNTDRPPRTSPYFIEVIHDNPPAVDLTKPGKNVQLPANGTLSLEGAAVDDYGVKSLTLRMQVAKGPALAPKIYRPGKSFRLESGKYPEKLDYKELVALDALKSGDGKVFPLATGMEIEYWLEASDNCDYPEPNVGRSKTYRVTITAPQKPDKTKQQRNELQKQQDEHEQKQDSDLDRRNQADADQNPDPVRDQKRREDYEQKAKQLNEAADRQEGENRKPGATKPDQSNEKKGDKKEPGGDKNGAKAGETKDQPPTPENKAGEQRGDGGNSQQAGETKDAGQPPKANTEQSPAQLKDNQQPPNPGAAKDDKSAGQTASATKNGGDPKQQEQVGASKEQGEDKADAGKTKDGGNSGGMDQVTKAEPKKGGTGDKVEPGQARGDGGDPKAAPNDQNRGQQKTPPMEQVAKGKNGAAGEKNDMSQARDGGENKTGDQQTNQGGVRGQDTVESKATSKQSDPKNGADKAATAKAGGPPQAENRPTTPEEARDAGVAKNDKSDPKIRPPDREPTLAEIAKLKDQLQDPKKRDDAARDLSQMAKETKDEKLRKAINEALKSMKTDNNLARAKESNDSKVAKSDAKTQGQVGEKNLPESSEAKKGDPKGETGTSKGSAEDGKKDTVKKAEARDPNSGGGSTNPKNIASTTTNQKGIDVDPSHRAGGLQLETLKKKLTPEVIRDLNWTPEEVKRFLQEARAYQEILRRQAQAKQQDTQKGGASTLLQSIGPTKQGHTSNTVDPHSLERPLPPPEFREAVERFNRPDATPPPEKK